MPMISLRLSDSEAELFKSYADINNISMSDFLRTSALDRIEDEFDLKAYTAALAAYKKNPKTFTLDEVEREIGLPQ